MKILYDYQMFDTQIFGGISRYFANLIAGLDRYSGMEAEVSVLFTKNYYLKDQRKWKISRLVSKLLFSNQQRLRSWNKNFSKYRIAKGDFDLFHPTYFHPYFLKFLKKPFVITVHDMIYELFPKYFSSIDFTAQNKKKIVAAATHIIAISETTKSDLMKLLHVPAEKITVVYHGHVPVSNITEPDLNLPARYIFFVGSRDNYKNFKTLAAAFLLVKEKDSAVKLICAGGGTFTVEESSYLQELGISSDIIQYDVADSALFWMYKKALAFVYPSLYEGFGLPILEAFEAGCPAILSDTPSFKEVAGEAAIYFDPYDANAMAKCIIDSIDNKELLDALIYSGKVRLRDFTMERCIAATVAVYRKVLRN